MSRPQIKSTGLELELTERTDREEHHLLRLAFVDEISFRFCLNISSENSILKVVHTEYFLVTTVVICTVV